MQEEEEVPAGSISFRQHTEKELLIKKYIVESTSDGRQEMKSLLECR
jgi:hypothetical protein